MVTSSSPAQVQTMQREGFLAQWVPVIVPSKSPEEIVSMDYINEKLLETDHGGKVIVQLLKFVFIYEGRYMMLGFVVENLLYPDALIYRARLKADFGLCRVLSEPMMQAASNK